MLILIIILSSFVGFSFYKNNMEFDFARKNNSDKNLHLQYSFVNQTKRFFAKETKV